jgi:hypothetical protein
MADVSVINELTVAKNASAWVSTSLSFRARLEQRKALSQIYPAITGYMDNNWVAVLTRAISNVQTGAE